MNIADPPQIVVVDAADPIGLRRVVPVGHAGPHGLDIDVARRRLFCACDAGVLLEIDADSGEIVATEPIAGVPDVVFFNATLDRLYVAIGEPGVIEVFDTVPLRRHETVATEVGAHTLSFDAARNVVCAFLPATHRAAVYEDDGDSTDYLRGAWSHRSFSATVAQDGSASLTTESHGSYSSEAAVTTVVHGR